MKEFALLFRQPEFENFETSSPERMRELSRKWSEWIGALVAQQKFVRNGARLGAEGAVLKPGGVVTDGPFVEIREKLGGYLVIKAGSLDEAVALAEGCPAIEVGGSVEIRPVLQ